jgi:hypothetical protein
LCESVTSLDRGKGAPKKADTSEFEVSPLSGPLKYKKRSIKKGKGGIKKEGKYLFTKTKGVSSWGG